MNKKFDCVAMKHKSAEKIYEKIKELSIEEELKFWQEQSNILHKNKDEITKKHGFTS